jgi:type III restriction enzyme
MNSPFDEPRRHFKFDDEGITSEILNGRRPSSHFVPIPRAKKKSKHLQFETEWTKDRIEPNPVVKKGLPLDIAVFLPFGRSPVQRTSGKVASRSDPPAR